DLNTLMLEKIEDSVSVSAAVDGYSFEVDFREKDLRNIETTISAKLFSNDMEKEVELNTTISLKKSQCKSCSRKHGNYYEAILQIRPTNKAMTDDQKDYITKIVHERVSLTSDNEKKVFITSELEKHGGLDFYLSDKKTTKRLSKEIADKYGGEITTSAELAGMEDGQEVYRMTYSVRLPEYEKNDFVEYESKIYRIKKINPKAGYIVLFDLKTGELKNIDNWDADKLSVLGGEELIKKAVVVSENEKELKLLDPDSYKTVTVLRPDNTSIEEGEVKIVKVNGKIYPIAEKTD
ncbi:MAG: 60S ribosomal export protein NMD3, partial [Thermoplasmatota archaeon]